METSFASSFTQQEHNIKDIKYVRFEHKYGCELLQINALYKRRTSFECGSGGKHNGHQGMVTAIVYMYSSVFKKRKFFPLYLLSHLNESAANSV